MFRCLLGGSHRHARLCPSVFSRQKNLQLGLAAHYWQLNVCNFKAKPGLHSSRTTREIYIVRPCLKTQKPKRKKKREKSLWTFLPLNFEITWFSWMLTQRSSSFVVIILFDFFILKWQYWNSSMFIYLILPISLVCTQPLFVNTTMHSSSQSEHGNTCAQRLQASGTCAAATSAVNLATRLPIALYPSPGCTVLWTLWRLVKYQLVTQTSNYTMHQHVINQLSTVFYTLLNYVYNVWLKVSVLIIFKQRMF